MSDEQEIAAMAAAEDIEAPSTLKTISITIDQATGITETTIDGGFSPIELWGISRMLDTHASVLWSTDQMQKQMDERMAEMEQRSGIIPATSMPQDRKPKHRRN